MIAQRCLNPYSNGTLSDKLKESALDFSCFLIPCYNPVPVRELVPSEKFFANIVKGERRKSSLLEFYSEPHPILLKCIRFHPSFQIKMRNYLLNLLNANGLCFRKSNACLNNFGDLRKSHFYGFCKSLKMNTLNQRPKGRLALFFANVWIKYDKRNFCENFKPALKHTLLAK